MKKLYIWGWHSVSQVNSIKKSDFEVLRWFTNIKGKKNKDSLVDMVYNPEKITLEVDFMPDDLLSIVKENFQKFSEMYSRINYSRALTTQEITNIFHYYLKYFYQDLITLKPDYILFSSFPHFGPDLALYLCAEVLNIKRIITFQTLFENKFFAVNSLDDFLNVDKQAEHSNNNIKIQKSYKKELFYMNSIKKAKKVCFLSLVRNMINLFLNKKRPLSLSGSVQKYEECKTDYLSLNTKTTIDSTKKYVYFPLQLQPEMTTSMLGGMYYDQLLALEQLSRIIPNDWKIYVKENPKQTKAQRGKYFFKRLQSIPKVEYVSSSINTYYLIENSELVSVVTGTAGWEAISGGKNVLIFGLAWYSSLPGVFKYDENISIQNILSYKINHIDLEQDINNLLNRAYDGIVDPNYNKMLQDYNDEKNEELLLKFLNKVLV